MSEEKEIVMLTPEDALQVMNPDGTVSIHVRDLVPKGTVYFSKLPECRGVLCNPEDEARLLEALKEETT